MSDLLIELSAVISTGISGFVNWNFKHNTLSFQENQHIKWQRYSKRKIVNWSVKVNSRAIAKSTQNHPDIRVGKRAKGMFKSSPSFPKSVKASGNSSRAGNTCECLILLYVSECPIYVQRKATEKS